MRRTLVFVCLMAALTGAVVWAGTAITAASPSKAATTAAATSTGVTSWWPARRPPPTAPC